MPRCLYCRDSAASYSTREHFLPEQLAKGHPFFLSPGAVCDPFQNWASRDLDPAIWKEDIVVRGSLFLSRVGGKKGLSKLLAHGDVFDPATGAMRIGEDGRRPEQRRGDSIMFSRAVTKIALGALVWSRGLEVALSSECDQPGRFVRWGQPAKIRPYGRACGRWIDPAVGLAITVESEGPGHLVTIQIHGVTLWTCLGGSLEAHHRKLSGVPGVHVFDASDRAEHLNVRTFLTNKIFFEPDGVRLETAVRPVLFASGGTVDPRSFELPAVQIFDSFSALWAA
jgi:hypothetical protein